MIVPTVAVVPTRDRGNDPKCLLRCVAAIAPQVELVVIVDNNDEPRGYRGVNVAAVHVPMQPPNLSVLYNTGMDEAARFAAAAGWATWNVATLNDDVEVPPEWVDLLDDHLRGDATPAVAAYVDRLGRAQPVLNTEPAASFEHTMTCWAALIRGETGIRWDEDLWWWYSDNMLDLVCRRAGGVIAVPGRIPAHTHPNEQTYTSPMLSELAGRDADTWNRKAKAMGL